MIAAQNIRAQAAEQTPSQEGWPGRGHPPFSGTSAPPTHDREAGGGMRRQDTCHARLRGGWLRGLFARCEGVDGSMTAYTEVDHGPLFNRRRQPGSPHTKQFEAPRELARDKELGQKIALMGLALMVP